MPRRRLAAAAALAALALAGMTAWWLQPYRPAQASAEAAVLAPAASVSRPGAQRAPQAAASARNVFFDMSFLLARRIVSAACQNARRGASIRNQG